jgi:hypothetical protein
MLHWRRSRESSVKGGDFDSLGSQVLQRPYIMYRSFPILGIGAFKVSEGSTQECLGGGVVLPRAKGSDTGPPPQGPTVLPSVAPTVAPSRIPSMLPSILPSSVLFSAAIDAHA